MTDARSSRSRRLIEDALAIEREDAVKAGALLFMARLFCQVGFPHSDPGRKSETGQLTLPYVWERRNGLVRLSLVANPAIGLAYGKVPRMVLVYLTSEAVRTGSPRIDLGRSLSVFLDALDMGAATGGRTGTVTRIREQLRRLLTTTVSATLDELDDSTGRKVFRDTGWRISEKVELCWHARQPEQAGLWGSYVDLTPRFFEIIRERPVPVDRRALRGLRSSLAMDLLFWLAYRLSYLTEAREIPWAYLETQLGAHFASTRDFRKAVLRQLGEVLKVYPQARVSVKRRGLILNPSRPLVPPKGACL